MIYVLLEQNKSIVLSKSKGKYVFSWQVYVHSPEDALYMGQGAEPDLGKYGFGNSHTIYFRVSKLKNNVLL